MLHKVFALILLVTSAAILTTAQTPEPKVKKDVKVFSFGFDGGGYLGIQTVEVTKENFSKFGLRDVRGVAVEKVIDGSPAKAAGLQDGDVIVKFNGEEVTSVRKLTRLIGETAPDHQARITVLRGGNEREFTATMGKRPMPKFEEGAFSYGFPQGRIEIIPDMPEVPPMGEMPRVRPFPRGEGDRDFYVFRSGSHRRIGVGITPLTKQLAEHFGVENGVLINNVAANSPAAKAGLKAGDIISEVDGKAVKGEFDLIRAIGEKKEGDVSLTIVRDRNRQTIRVTPGGGKGEGIEN